MYVWWGVVAVRGEGNYNHEDKIQLTDSALASPTPLHWMVVAWFLLQRQWLIPLVKVSMGMNSGPHKSLAGVKS